MQHPYYNAQPPIILIAHTIKKSADKCRTLQQIEGCRNWIKAALFGRYNYSRALNYALPLYGTLTIKEVFIRAENAPIEVMEEMDFEEGNG